MKVESIEIRFSDGAVRRLSGEAAAQWLDLVNGVLDNELSCSVFDIPSDGSSQTTPWEEFKS